MPRPTESPTFFVDRSLGARDVADALRAAGELVEIHDDHFAPDTPDVTWLSIIGRRGWVVLTKDDRIRRHPLELAALESSGVAAFILTAQSVTGADMAKLFVAALPRIHAVLRTRSRPFIATVTAAGQVTVIRGGARRGAVRRV